ncbi:Protein kintoun, partial [Acropora cervicornis]
ELDKFEKAMKDEEFRKLLVEYAKEISDPENKKKYEEEITQMEKMRGMDVKFVNPVDGYVVKTTDSSTGVKAFINICSNHHIAKAWSQFAEREENGKKKSGHQWNIPYSLSTPRDDIDRAGKKCVVYDAVFHPDTYSKGQEGPVESAEFKVGDQTFPYPYDNKTTTADTDEEGKLLKENKEDQTKANSPLDPIVPKDANSDTRPKEIVVYIELPKLDSAAPVELDILEKQLLLNCKNPCYHLDISLLTAE